MHYTSVPNILKVLNPLFLDDLRARLEEAGDNARKLLNLRKRMARSAYSTRLAAPAISWSSPTSEMREIEAEINRRRREERTATRHPADKFSRHRIARFSRRDRAAGADHRGISMRRALSRPEGSAARFLAADAQNWITCGNALRLDWLSVCPPTGTGVKHHAEDLFARRSIRHRSTSRTRVARPTSAEIRHIREVKDQTEEQKADLRSIFEGSAISSGSADYVFGWFAKGSRFARTTNAVVAFVTTNSIHQGRQVARFWPYLLSNDLEIVFAEPSFKWSNLAAKKAVVTVSVIGVARRSARRKVVYSTGLARQADVIGPYLVPNIEAVVDERREPISKISVMMFGSMPNDGGNLLMSFAEATQATKSAGVARDFIRPAIGTEEFINGIERRCIWVGERDYIASYSQLVPQHAFQTC